MFSNSYAGVPGHHYKGIRDLQEAVDMWNLRQGVWVCFDFESADSRVDGANDFGWVKTYWDDGKQIVEKGLWIGKDIDQIQHRLCTRPSAPLAGLPPAVRRNPVLELKQQESKCAETLANAQGIIFRQGR